jgi:hypothetical protein
MNRSFTPTDSWIATVFSLTSPAGSVEPAGEIMPMMERWKNGGPEEWNDGMMEGWNSGGRGEDRKIGILE